MTTSAQPLSERPDGSGASNTSEQGADSVPPVRSSRPLARSEEGTFGGRLVRLMALRLFVLTLFLAFVTLVYLRGQTGGLSSLMVFGTVAAAYAMSAIYAVLLRAGRFLRGVAYAQILTDQLSWTAIVYVTGGVSSGATSLYGLTCIAGAVALGRKGALVAVVSALVAYIGLAACMIEAVLPVPSDQNVDMFVSTWSAAAYPMLANSIGLALVASMSGYLAERLRVAGGDLAIAEARAEQAEHMAALGRLATGLAHEIRNPLGGISGSIELLRGSPNLTEEDRRLCEIVQREAARLNDLVGDMLDLSRPRSPQFEEVDVAQLARDVVALASQSGRGEEVAVRYRGPTMMRLSGDSSQLRQLLWNLIRNAIQASVAGDHVLVELSKSPRGEAVIAVSDQGPGIPAEAKDKIFDAFFTTRSHGTGVGLAVVKRIVDAHGWQVEVTKGPRARSAGAEDDEHRSPAGRGSSKQRTERREPASDREPPSSERPFTDGATFRVVAPKSALLEVSTVGPLPTETH